MQSDKLISIVIPVYNEGADIKNAYNRIKETLKNEYKYEIIFVDDGSADNTFCHISEIVKNHAEVKAIRLITNCGTHIAVRAGFDYSTGDVACFISCDMQEPPSLIPIMYNELKEPYGIVWAVRNSRKDNFFVKLLSYIFHSLARLIVSKNIPPSGASMFMINYKVLNALKLYNERNLTLEGLFATIGYKATYVRYDRLDRISGKSKWTLSKKTKLFVDFFVAYSYVPIRIISILGISLAILGFIWTLYIILRQLIVKDLISGWPALISILLVSFGITNISLGIIAEYLWRTLDETRKRPRYIIDKTVNINNNEK